MGFVPFIYQTPSSISAWEADTVNPPRFSIKLTFHYLFDSIEQNMELSGFISYISYESIFKAN